jgi:ferredoxin
MPLEDNLITCDLVCSGVASPMAWRSYLRYLERHYGELETYEHRPKSFGGKHGSRLPERARFKDGTMAQGAARTKTWSKAYVGRWSLRPTCHDCPFHSMERPADITIGDFWGLSTLGGTREDEGVSLVLQNSRRAEVSRLVEALLSVSRWQEYPANAACNPSQPRLASSPEPNKVRGIFLRGVARAGFGTGFYLALAVAGVRRMLRQNGKNADPALLGKEPVMPPAAGSDSGAKRLQNRLVATKGDCYGCGACVNVCPKGAIRMREDAEGFAYPVIDDDACVSCGLCNKACPRSHGGDIPVERASVAYAVQIEDRERFSKSSSGGAFWGLASRVLLDGGVVYGVAFGDGNVPVHIRCSTASQAMRCMGSKYAQSDVGECYGSVLQDLRAGRKVLFTGTPCQVAALKRYVEQAT